MPRVRRLVEEINGLDFEPELIVHSGDVVDVPSDEAYALAQVELGKLRAPVYYACGNHDEGGMLLAQLSMGERELFGEGISELAYSVKAGAGRIFVLDGCDAGRKGGAGEMTGAQFEAFKAAVRGSEEPFLVFVHFPPLALDSPWVDGRMLLEGGDALHEFLASEARERVGGVFFGHVHGSVSLWRDGIAYRAVGSACCRIRTGPKDEKPSLVPRIAGGIQSRELLGRGDDC